MLLALPGALADEGPGPQLGLVGSYDTSSDAQDVAVSGDYAYVAVSGGGLVVVNISDPTNPTWAGDFATSSDSTLGVAVSGGYAYLADYNNGLVVMNVSDPANPTWVGDYGTPGYAWDVAVAGDYAYVADGESGLEVVNVSDPTNPDYAGGYGTYDRAYGVVVAGDYAYVADGSNGLEVLDVSDPTNPTLAGGSDTFGNAQEVAVAGGYAYIADGTHGLAIVNVNDPTNPTWAGGFITNDYAYGVVVAGDYAYVTDQANGLMVVDVSNPTYPIYAGSYDTSGYASGVAVAGDYVYVADDYRGLVVLGPDSDGDGVLDVDDLFPSDHSEWADADSDGMGDNGDAFPSDPAASVDRDRDGFPDEWNGGNSQVDSTTGLQLDLYPSDPDEWVDSDGDGVGDNGDPLPSNPILKAWWQMGLILATFGIAAYSTLFSFRTRKAFRETAQALEEWESAGVNTSPVRKMLDEGHKKWKHFNYPAAITLAAQAKEKGEEHAREHGSVQRIFEHVEEKLQGYEAEGAQVGPARNLLEQAQSAHDDMDFQKAEGLADQALTKGMALESQYQAAVEKVTELRAKIAEFEEKGINTDELERVLAECEAEMGTVAECENEASDD
jgi:hypothetical protein